MLAWFSVPLPTQFSIACSTIKQLKAGWGPEKEALVVLFANLHRAASCFLG